MPDFASTFWGEALNGIESRTGAKGYSLVVGATYNNRATEALVIARVKEARIDGLIVVAEQQKLFDTFRVPSVLMNCEMPTLSCSQIAYNHRKGGFLATRHLLELGHRKIACLSGDDKASAYVNSRVEGYFWAYEAMGLPRPERSVFPGDYLDDKCGYQYADEIFNKGYTAVFACTDRMACGFYRRARELNMRIPEDVSVMGYDDLYFSALLDPPLSSVHQSGVELGIEAANRLIQEIEDRTVPHQSIYFDPTLVIRQSTRPPAGV